MKQRLKLRNKAKESLSRLILSVLSVIMAVTFFAVPANATSVYDLPQISAESTTWVVDKADAISLANEGKLNNTLKQLAQNTGNELRLVAIRRLDYGDTIESFTDKLFKTWYPSPEEQANQSLLVIDTLSNNTAIESGDTIKQLLNDDIAKSVIDESIGLRLKEGDKYNQAFLEASDRLVAVLSGQPDPGSVAVAKEIETEGTFTKAEDTDAGNATVWVIGFLIVATIVPMVTYFWYVGFPGN
jgi:uncharacterized protein